VRRRDLNATIPFLKMVLIMGKRLKIIMAAGLLLSFLLLLMPVIFPLTDKGGADWVTAIGRFHILVLHFPIALLLIVPVLELLSIIPSLRFMRQTIPVLLALAILFAFNACILGYMLATGEGIAGGLLTDHMWAGIITTILMVVALILHQIPAPKVASIGYFGFLGLSIISLTIGSHNGASLVHGEDYLTEKIPASIKSIFRIGQPAEPITKDSSVYKRLIQPIFEEHCYLCHSEAKKKSDFRVDDYELLLYGGESGMEGVAPGNLEDSEVHYRITLDPKRKGFMPPEGNTPLTADQIAMIRWWIESGASPTLTIGELSGDQIPEAVKKLLGDH
jgi:hypothetical protein